MILKKIILPSVIWLSVLAHVVVVYQFIPLSIPRNLRTPEPVFPMVDAVVVEIPNPEPVPEITVPQETPLETPRIEPAVVEEEPVEAPVETPVDEIPEPIDEIPEETAADVVVAEESPPATSDEPVENMEPTVQSSRAAESSPAPDAESGPVQPEQEKVFLPFYRVEKRPAFRYQPELRYPQQARRQRIEGKVIIDADIDERGELIRTIVIKNAGFGFEEAAIEMLEASEFSPAIIDGRPVAVRMRFTIEFRLD